MKAEDVQVKLSDLREIDLEPVKEQISDFVDTLPERYAEAVDQIKRRLGLKPRTRREVIGDWLNEHGWVPVVLGAGLVATVLLVTRSRVHE